MVLVCKFMLLSVQMFYLKVQICPEKCLARFLIVTKGGPCLKILRSETQTLKDQPHDSALVLRALPDPGATAEGPFCLKTGSLRLLGDGGLCNMSRDENCALNPAASPDAVRWRERGGA